MERRSGRQPGAGVLSTVLTAFSLAPWLVRQGGDPDSALFHACGAAAVVLLLGFLVELVLAGLALRDWRRLARERALELIAHAGLGLTLIDLLLGGSLVGLSGASGAIALSFVFRISNLLWSLLGGVFFMTEKDRVSQAELEREAELDDAAMGVGD